MQRPQIVRFQPGLEDQIIALILPIQQREFGVQITAEDQPDLRRIPEIYQAQRGDFWVGLVGETVVATLGLIDFGGGGALRKMFVAKDQRGSGVAQSLLDTLIAHATSAAIPALALGTLAQMHAAHRFYERNGFIAATPDQLPAGFPRMPVDDRFYLRALC
jgi:GNAT superfamily N-acetyltransferase